MSKNYMNDSQASEIVKYISDTMKFPIMGAGGGFAPIGMYGWSPDYVTGAPQGWLRCEGQIINIADYPELATFYASQHGASNYWGGDGITTFAVPDLRGEFPRGAGTNSHANQGNGGAVGEHQDGTEFPMYMTNGNNIQIDGNATNNKIKDYDGVTKTREKTFSVATTTGTWGTEPSMVTSRPTNTSGVFFVKATVSGDANAHQYSTEEQVVGMDENGNYIYEKTITGLSVSMIGDTFTVIPSFSISANNISIVREAKGMNGERKVSFPLITYTDGDTLKVMISRPNSTTTILGMLIIQYTKTQ